MDQKYKILTVVTVVVIITAGYYGYEQYNFLNMQEDLKMSMDYKISADNYSNQAYAHENKSDYTNAISMWQKCSNEISKAIESDNNALTHANGAYEEYINNDVLLLKTTSKLIDFHIYLDQVESNTLNQGQEKVSPADLYPHINQLKDDIAVYKNNANKIISASPDKFKFLNSSSK